MVMFMIMDLQHVLIIYHDLLGWFLQIFGLEKNYFDSYLGFFYEKMTEILQILIRIKKSCHGSTTHVPTSRIFFLGFCMFVCFLPLKKREYVAENFDFL